VAQAEAGLRLTNDGHISNRFDTAVTALGDDSMAVRLGGLYSLQRIMEDSRRDHPRVILIISAYIQQHAPASIKRDKERQAYEKWSKEYRKWQKEKGEKQRRQNRRPGVWWHSWEPIRPNVVLPPPLDAEAAVKIITSEAARSIGGAHPVLSNTSLDRVNLNNMHLGTAELQKAELEGTSLVDADLRWARLCGTNLSYADLTGTDIRNIQLDYAANLSGTNLNGADLRGTDLRGIQLSETSMVATNLTGADLRGADLSENWRFTLRQLLTVNFDKTTRLPPHLEKEPRVAEKLAKAPKIAEHPKAENACGTRPLPPEPDWV
jgi:hypothetical protein